MDWQKSILQKDITYYFKYREFSGIFTIHDHISENSIQLNIKYAMYVNISLSHIYIYIYIYIYTLCVFCLFQDCGNTCKRWSHLHGEVLTGFKHSIKT